MARLDDDVFYRQSDERHLPDVCTESDLSSPLTMRAISTAHREGRHCAAEEMAGLLSADMDIDPTQLHVQRDGTCHYYCRITVIRYLDKAISAPDAPVWLESRVLDPGSYHS